MNNSSLLLNFEAPLVEIMSAALAQGSIDIPDSMPAVDEILYSHAKIVDLDSTCNDGSMTINATINFIVVYLDRDGHKHSLEAKTAFKHDMSYPVIEENMWGDVKAECTNTECRVTTATAISAQCVVEVSGWAYKEHSVQVAGANDSEDANIQSKSSDVIWVQSVVKAYGNNTVRQDIRLNDAQAQVKSIIDNRAQFIIENVDVKGGKVIVSGYVLLDILYSNEKGITKTTAKLESQVTAENPDIFAGEFVCPEVTVKNIDIKIYEDENGNRKILSVEIPIFAKVYQEVAKEKSIVTDAYGIKAPVLLEYMDIELPQKTIVINKTNCQISEKLVLDDKFSDSELISLGDITVETVVSDNKKISITGTMALRVWSIDGKYTIADTSYTLEVLTDKDYKNSMLECVAKLKSINIYKNNSNEWVCNGEVDVNIKVTSRKNMRLVSGIELEEEYEEDLYPLMLAITTKDDTLWSIARRCRVTIDDILELNPYLANEVVAGNPVIVYRKIK